MIKREDIDSDVFARGVKRVAALRIRCSLSDLTDGIRSFL
jgi:hypothetical protein